MLWDLFHFISAPPFELLVPMLLGEFHLLLLRFWFEIYSEVYSFFD